MILVCGEALIDLFVSRGGDGHPVVDARIGGSPLNLAVGLARLGEAVGFFGGLSTDAFGMALQDFLRRENVDLSLARISAAPSMQAVVGLDGRGNATYSFPVSTGADRLITIADLPETLDPAVAAITFGSYPLIMPPVADAYFRLAEREAGRRVICLDPNVRLAIAPDGGVWRQRFEATLPLSDIVKASDDDIRACYGEGSSLADVARSWLGLGASIVVVTLGAEGCVAFLRDGRSLECRSRRVPVVDTVGAGDSFFAAMLSCLKRQDLLSRAALDKAETDLVGDALKRATDAAAVTCGRRGADLPTGAYLALLRGGAAAPPSRESVSGPLRPL